MMLDRIQYLMDGVKQVSDNIAHELRKPLTRMRNNLVTFEKNCNQNDLSIVQQLIVEADNMLGTFNALQRIARVELGDSSIEKAQLKLHQLLGDVIELYEPVASEKSITFEVSIVDVDIVADRNLLFQAFANLLDNAIKYTPENGHVVITLSTKDDYQLLTPKQAAFKPQAILTVADNGCGIAKQNYSKVFRRFYREEGSRGKQPGNGLGLSLVAAVAKVHSSQVILKPNDPGLRVHMVFS
jgi:signal transduction histidine kinase